MPISINFPVSRVRFTPLNVAGIMPIVQLVLVQSRRRYDRFRGFSDIRKLVATTFLAPWKEMVGYQDEFVLSGTRDLLVPYHFSGS